MVQRDEQLRAYAVCIRNEGYEASLERRKLDQVLAAEPGDPPSMIRVLDESGEDYLFPSDWFYRVELPVKLTEALATV